MGVKPDTGIKPELATILDEMFAIGGNHDVKKDLEIRNKIINSFSLEELLLEDHNEINIRVGKSALHYLDANAVHVQTTDTATASKYMMPFFERLLQSDDWNYYELKLLIASMYLTPNIEQAHKLYVKAIKRISEFQVVREVDIQEGYLALNMCARLLYTKYFEDDVDIDWVTDQFETCFHRLEVLESIEDNYQLGIPLLVTKIRQAIFKQDEKPIREFMDELYNWSNSTTEIVNILKSEIRLYKTSEKYFALLGGEE